MGIIKNLYYCLIAITLLGCGANHHVRKAEYHIAKAESKGAVWKQSEKVDTIYRDTTIVVEGNSMDESFSFIERDTVTIEKEKIVVKTIVDCKKKTANTKVVCPDKIVKVPQKYYINRRITRTLKTGLSNWQIGGFCLMGVFIGFALGKLLPTRRQPVG